MALFILALVIAAFWGLRALLAPSAAAADLRFATVERGPIENAVTASGIVTPSFEQQLNAPIATEIKEVLKRSGDRVEAGDLILRLDQEFIQLDVESRKSQLELKQNQIGLLQLELDRDLKELEYDDAIKGLEVASAVAKLADARRLEEIGGATAEEVEQAEVQLKILQFQKKKLENELQYRRASLAGRRLDVELEAKIEEKELREIQRKMGMTEVRAPSPGVITWVNESIGEQVGEGNPLVRLADLRSFHIEASCSDRYADRVKLGQPVRVRINGRDLRGEVSSILPSVENNTLAFLVNLEDPSDAQLRPNMRLDVYVITDRKEDALRVQRGPAFNGARRQGLFVIRGDRAVRTEVSVGLSNGNFVEIQSDQLAPGDRIVISDTEDYEHLSSIKLN
jgi:HlyD family secretion protein